MRSRWPWESKVSQARDRCRTVREGHHHVMVVIYPFFPTHNAMRRIIFIFNRIMETSISRIRPASPSHVTLQPLDKRPRLVSPAPTLQAGVKSTAPKRSKREKKHTLPEFGSSEDVISREVVGLLGNQVVARAEADGVEWESPFGFREEVELTVSSISSSGMSHFKVYPDVVFFVSPVHTFTVIDEDLLEQVKGWPLYLHQTVHGSSSFRSRCLERLSAPACTGMQGCTPLQT